MNGLPERRLDAMACFAPLDAGAVCSWLGGWNHSLGFARVLHLLSVYAFVFVGLFIVCRYKMYLSL